MHAFDRWQTDLTNGKIMPSQNSQLNRNIRLGAGVVVQDSNSNLFLCENDVTENGFTNRLSEAHVFPDFDGALTAGRQFCGASGFSTLSFGNIPLPVGVVDNVIFD